MKKEKHTVGDWLIRLLKGIVIGFGAILPGLSGGVLAVIFGVYDRMIAFLGNIRKNFLKQVSFFFPILLGGGIGVLVFSFAVKAAFDSYKAQFVCLFIGFVIGTFPSLFRQAGKQGRSARHYLIMLLSTAVIFALMLLGEHKLIAVTPSVPVWFAAGALIGLGVIVPGMSPSNFLIYFDLYDKMAAGVSNLDPSVILPLTLGLIVCVLLFAKLAAWLFKKYYAEMYHLILGMVIGSSLAIFPTIIFPALRGPGLAATGMTLVPALLFCLVMLVAGIAGSTLFARLEAKYVLQED
jgi:putative membrane protein